jgi:hypothetical protein
LSATSSSDVGHLFLPDLVSQTSTFI